MRSVGYIADPHTGQVIGAKVDGSSPVLDSVRDCILVKIIKGLGLFSDYGEQPLFHGSSCKNYTNLRNFSFPVKGGLSLRGRGSAERAFPAPGGGRELGLSRAAGAIILKEDRKITKAQRSSTIAIHGNA